MCQVGVRYCWWFRNPKQPLFGCIKPYEYWDIYYINWWTPDFWTINSRDYFISQKLYKDPWTLKQSVFHGSCHNKLLLFLPLMNEKICGSQIGAFTPRIGLENSKQKNIWSIHQLRNIPCKSNLPFKRLVYPWFCFRWLTLLTSKALKTTCRQVVRTSLSVTPCYAPPATRRF